MTTFASNDRWNILLYLSALIAIIILLSIYFYNNNGPVGNSEEFAYFGGYVGGTITPVLTFVTVVLLIRSIGVQIESVKQSSLQLKKSEQLHSENVKHTILSSTLPFIIENIRTLEVSFKSFLNNEMILGIDHEHDKCKTITFKQVIQPGAYNPSGGLDKVFYADEIKEKKWKYFPSPKNQNIRYDARILLLTQLSRYSLYFADSFESLFEGKAPVSIYHIILHNVARDMNRFNALITTPDFLDGFNKSSYPAPEEAIKIIIENAERIREVYSKMTPPYMDRAYHYSDGSTLVS